MFFVSEKTYHHLVSSHTLKSISFVVLLKIFAHIVDLSRCLSIIGVLSSTITFFLTSIILSLYQKKLFLEFQITITLKFVILSGKSKLTLALPFLSVMISGL
jgi:hypothetical protein